MGVATRRPLKVGLLFATWENPANGVVVQWRDVRERILRAEELGFDSVWMVDHFLFRHPPEATFGFWDGWSCLAAIAEATTRVELGLLVACTSYRHPVILAKAADTIDEISGGRTILGLGAGWTEAEFRALGAPYDHRVSRFEEALTIIATLLREGEIDFDGQYYQARECELHPRGPRPKGPPIMVGATRDRMSRLAARHADILNRDFGPTSQRGTHKSTRPAPALAATRQRWSGPWRLRSICRIPRSPCHGTRSPAHRRNWRKHCAGSRRMA